MQRLPSSIDHLVYNAFDLSLASRDLEKLLGGQAVPGGRHPEWGTHNALLALGNEIYLEILAPDPSAFDTSRDRPFGLDRLESPGLATWAVRSGDLEMAVKLGRQAGLDLGTVRSGSRRRPDGTLLQWRLTDIFMAREAGLVPFFIDWGGAVHPAVGLPKGCTLLGIRGFHPHASHVRRVLSRLGLELTVESHPIPGLTATVRTPRGTVEIPHATFRQEPAR